MSVAIFARRTCVALAEVENDECVTVNLTSPGFVSNPGFLFSDVEIAGLLLRNLM